MAGSRHSQFDPYSTFQFRASTSSEQPIRCPDDTPNTPYKSAQPSHLSNSSATGTSDRARGVQERSVVFGSQNEPNPGSHEGSFPPRLLKRRTSGSSLFKVASSAWSTTRAFAISHFNVPKAAAPWEHELDEKQTTASLPSPSVRFFDHGRQRRRLCLNSSFQFLITALICAAMASCLYGFSTMIYGMDSTVKRVFNALITGLSLCLGLNLASSLKGYSQMMRWRFLASEYRTLQDFELVMNCDSQTKTFRLLWAGRTRGRWYPNKTQILAFCWLVINIALQVCTALLGLTYSVDVSSEYVRLTYGTVSVSDVAYVGNDDFLQTYGDDLSSPQALLAQTAVANQWGITGQDYSVFTTTFDSYFGNDQSVYTDEAQDVYWYRFIDRSPLAYIQTTVTWRTVNATASCQSHPVAYGGYGGFQTNDTDLMWMVTWLDHDGTENTWWIDDVATGATTWMANTSSACGSRCVQLYALQTADNTTDDVPVPRFWTCESTVSHVEGTDQYLNPQQYQIADTQAAILAGAIGWSGVVTTDGGDSKSNIQMVRYPVDSQWSPPGSITEAGMAQLVMKFTAGAISALDNNGPRLNVTGYGPAPALVLNVKWNYAGAILGGIPFVQGLIFLGVIMLASKAIIKDTSHLATARLLRPIVEKLGDTGCLLTGDEIAERLGNYRVIYGVRDAGMGNVPTVGAGDDGQIRHVDILEESEGLGCRRGRMPQGRYDGIHGSSRDDTHAT